MTVLLPISLVRLLSSQDLHSQDIIRNTMDLAQAIIIASKRTTSPQWAAEYDKYMTRYCTALKTLFPNFDSFSKPNFHLALHLSALLLRFGPAHGWWSYAFEHLIGLLTCLGTNNKLGNNVSKVVTDPESDLYVAQLKCHPWLCRSSPELQNWHICCKI